MTRKSCRVDQLSQNSYLVINAQAGEARRDVGETLSQALEAAIKPIWPPVTTSLPNRVSVVVSCHQAQHEELTEPTIDTICQWLHHVGWYCGFVDFDDGTIITVAHRSVLSLTESAQSSMVRELSSKPRI